MKQEDIGVGYVILGYILLPFMALFKVLKKGTQGMTDTQATFYYFLLIVIILQLIEVITNF